MYQTVLKRLNSSLQPTVSNRSFKLIDAVTNEVSETFSHKADLRTYDNSLVIERNHIIPFLNQNYVIKNPNSDVLYKKYSPGVTLAHHFPNRLLKIEESNRLPIDVYVNHYIDLDGLYNKSFIKAVNKSDAVPLLYKLIGKNCITFCINGSPPLSDMENVVNWVNKLKKLGILNGIELYILCHQPSQIWTKWMASKFSDELAKYAVVYGNYIASFSKISWQNTLILSLYKPHLVSLLLTDKMGYIRWHSIGTPSNESLNILSKCTSQLLKTQI